MRFALKLTALFISIGTIFATAMFTIAYFQVTKTLESEIRERMENRVFFTMDVMDRFLYERLSDIKMIAKDSVISFENATAEQITEKLIFFRNAYKCYISLSFFNLERIRIADTTGLNIGKQNRMTRYWEDVLSGKVSAASDVHIAEDLQMPVVYFASTVNNKEGRAMGVVVARILTSRLFEMVKTGAGIQEEEEEEEINIVNKDGLLIYSNYNREGILKDNLSNWESVERARQGKILGSAMQRHPVKEEETLHAFCREQGYLDFKGNDWTIIFHVPPRVIFGPVNKLLNLLIIMFLAMLPGLALVIYFFSKTVTQPLTRLSFAAAEIGKGKLDTVIEVKSKDEFGSLANTFSQMVADLKKTTTSIGNLNKEIIDRKKAEEKLNQALKEALTSREILTSMLDDNNQIREELERKLEELKQAQDMLVQSEKLASLGNLVSDMAHEVNNPLMVISGRAQLSLMEELQKKEIENNFKIIIDQCERAKAIIHRLLIFSKPSKGELKEVDINETLEFVIKLIEHQYSLSDVKIIRNFTPSLPKIKVDDKQMHEVFMNILKNATEAMANGGTITISTSLEADFIRIDFKDTGEGMSQEAMKRIFDPFFTTKEQGTGLGLSVCYGIIKAHKGELKYESKPGEGTTAIIHLPIGGVIK